MVTFLSVSLTNQALAKGRLIYPGASIYTLPNDKISDWSKMKVFADNKINVSRDLKFIWKG